MPVLAFRRQVDRMASREGDISLWLHNKLGSTDDLWSGNSICSQLSRDKLLSIQDCFHNLQPYVKVKLMLSFLHLAKRNVEEWKVELEEILQLAQDDTDQWVAMVGDILKTFPASGGLNTDIDDQHSFFHEVLTDLRKLVKKSHDAGMLPLECHYLNRLALQSVAGQQPQPVKHFALKRKPKSAALRAEILQKSSEAANNLKKTGASSSVPVKFRSFAKKMDEENPQRSRGATGFLKSNSLSRSSFGGSHLGNRSASSRRDCGIKLLDIDEVPVGGREAKRRKKQAEQEALELQKKEKEAQSNTPDYAAGLMSPAVGTVLNAGASTSGPNYVPSTTRLPAANTGGTTILPTNSISLATQQARDQLQQQLQQQLAPAQQQQQQQQQQQLQPPSQQQQQPQQGVVLKVVTSVSQPTSVAPPTATQQVVTHGQGQGQVQAAQQQPKRGLSLTREQMLQAQEMFKNSNKVTRPEKALILGFMAGARDNPCPQQGDIVNIRLSETLESVQQPDMMFRPMMVDSFFQMNYSTGEWKRIKKYRVPDPE